jgi:hypothetical protein
MSASSLTVTVPSPSDVPGSTSPMESPWAPLTPLWQAPDVLHAADTLVVPAPAPASAPAPDPVPGKQSVTDSDEFKKLMAVLDGDESSLGIPKSQQKRRSSDVASLSSPGLLASVVVATAAANGPETAGSAIGLPRKNRSASFDDAIVGTVLTADFDEPASDTESTASSFAQFAGLRDGVGVDQAETVSVAEPVPLAVALAQIELAPVPAPAPTPAVSQEVLANVGEEQPTGSHDYASEFLNSLFPSLHDPRGLPPATEEELLKYPEILPPCEISVQTDEEVTKSVSPVEAESVSVEPVAQQQLVEDASLEVPSLPVVSIPTLDPPPTIARVSPVPSIIVEPAEAAIDSTPIETLAPKDEDTFSAPVEQEEEDASNEESSANKLTQHVVEEEHQFTDPASSTDAPSSPLDFASALVAAETAFSKIGMYSLPGSGSEVESSNEILAAEKALVQLRLAAEAEARKRKSSMEAAIAAVQAVSSPSKPVPTSASSTRVPVVSPPKAAWNSNLTTKKKDVRIERLEVALERTPATSEIAVTTTTTTNTASSEQPMEITATTVADDASAVVPEESKQLPKDKPADKPATKARPPFNTRFDDKAAEQRRKRAEMLKAASERASKSPGIKQGVSGRKSVAPRVPSHIVPRRKPAANGPNPADDPATAAPQPLLLESSYSGSALLSSDHFLSLASGSSMSPAVSTNPQSLVFQFDPGFEAALHKVGISKEEIESAGGKDSVVASSVAPFQSPSSTSSPNSKSPRALKSPTTTAAAATTKKQTNSSTYQCDGDFLAWLEAYDLESHCDAIATFLAARRKNQKRTSSTTTASSSTSTLSSAGKRKKSPVKFGAKISLAELVVLPSGELGSIPGITISDRKKMAAATKALKAVWGVFEARSENAKALSISETQEIMDQAAPISSSAGITDNYVAPSSISQTLSSPHRASAKVLSSLLEKKLMESSSEKVDHRPLTANDLDALLGPAPSDAGQGSVNSLLSRALARNSPRAGLGTQTIVVSPTKTTSLISNAPINLVQTTSTFSSSSSSSSSPSSSKLAAAVEFAAKIAAERASKTTFNLGAVPTLPSTSSLLLSAPFPQTKKSIVGDNVTQRLSFSPTSEPSSFSATSSIAQTSNDGTTWRFFKPPSFSMEQTSKPSLNSLANAFSAASPPSLPGEVKNAPIVLPRTSKKVDTTTLSPKSKLKKLSSSTSTSTTASSAPQTHVSFDLKAATSKIDAALARANDALIETSLESTLSSGPRFKSLALAASIEPIPVPSVPSIAENAPRPVSKLFLHHRDNLKSEEDIEFGAAVKYSNPVELSSETSVGEGGDASMAVDPQENMLHELIGAVEARDTRLSASFNDVDPSQMFVSPYRPKKEAVEAEEEQGETPSVPVLDTAFNVELTSENGGENVDAGSSTAGSANFSLLSSPPPSAMPPSMSEELSDFLTSIGLYHLAPTLTAFGVVDLAHAFVLSPSNLRTIGVSEKDAAVLLKAQEEAVSTAPKKKVEEELVPSLQQALQASKGRRQTSSKQKSRKK